MNEKGVMVEEVHVTSSRADSLMAYWVRPDICIKKDHVFLRIIYQR